MKKLKHTSLGRNDEGIYIIESWQENNKLSLNKVQIGKEGIRGYLLSLGDFKQASETSQEILHHKLKEIEQLRFDNKFLHEILHKHKISFVKEWRLKLKEIGLGDIRL